MHSAINDVYATFVQMCSTHHTTQVRVFKDHPEGVVSIKYKTEEGAAACLSKMAGR